MLGGAHVHADAALVKVLEVQAAALDRFMRRVDRNTAGAGADAQFFAGLVLLRIEGADAGRDFAHIAHIDDLNTRDSIEEILSIFLESVAVGGSQADSCDDYSGLVHE